MLDEHGERLRARDLTRWLDAEATPASKLIIMADELTGKAALIAWDDEAGEPSSVIALNVPVFTRMPGYFDTPSAPLVSYDGQLRGQA